MISIDLGPEVEAKVRNSAAAAGGSVNDYLNELLDSYLDVQAAIAEGRADVAAGRTHPAREVLEELRAKYSLPNETTSQA